MAHQKFRRFPSFTLTMNISRSRRAWLPISLPIGLLLACDSPTDLEPGEGSSGSGEAPEVTVRFHEDIAPILSRSCNACHQEGAVGPFNLTSYADASAWGEALVHVTEARTMPPWNVDNSGECNQYVDARWLSDEEIALIRTWVEQGMAEGDPELGVPPPPQPRALQGGVITELSTPAGYQPVNEAIPSAPNDDYQCFLLDPGLDKDMFLIGHDVAPGNPASVHHVLVFDVDPESTLGGQGRNADVMAAKDAESPDQPGWSCLNAAGEGVWVEGVPVSWAPGAGATMLPEGTGIRLAAGHQLVVQMHYHLEDDMGPDQTAVQLVLAEEVKREAHATLMDGFLMTLLGQPAELPAGREDAEFDYEVALNAIPNFVVGTENVEVFGVLPHMHQRGRKMEVDFVVDGKPTCGARVAQWDYNWQQAYFYEQPLTMTMHDRLKVRCQWDTRGADAPVRPGLGTDAEMCLVGIYVAELPD